MRVLFVFPDLSSTITDYTGVVSYGIASLAATLRRDGHEPSLLHLTRATDEAHFRAAVSEARPDLVAFSSNSHYAHRLDAWTRWAHAASGAPVVVGGIHATLAPDHVSALPAVDFTCVGEGEDALAGLCRALESGRDPAGIGNLWVRRGDGTVVRGAPHPVAADLDALPDPDLSLFDVARTYNARMGTFTFLMSRGCAYGCTYCCVHALRRLAPRHGRFWRFLSPARAVDQLERLMRRHLPDARLVTFVDAILFPDAGWLAAFAPLYRQRIGLPFSCNLRADRVTDETAALLQQAGCRIARLGVESGDEHLTRDVLRRSLGVEDLRRGFDILRRHGIERWSYNMVGVPGETLREALATVRLNAELAPEMALPFIFYPYPGTELRRVAEQAGFMTEREFDNYQVDAVLRLPRFPVSDVRFVHRFFQPLIRLHAAAGRLGPGAVGALDAVLGSRLFPRAAITAAADLARRTRHALGGWLVRRAPALYRRLGGRAPAPSARAVAG